MTTVSMADVHAARELLRDVVRPTPLEVSRWLAGRVGGPVYLKCENLQRGGSFKIRGAYVRISRLSDDERGRGVVAATMPKASPWPPTCSVPRPPSSCRRVRRS